MGSALGYCRKLPCTIPLPNTWGYWHLPQVTY